MPVVQAASLAATRDALLALPHPFSRDAVHAVVEKLQVSPEELRPYLNFSDHYTRTLFYQGPRFEILVLCWKDGQASPIHDHAASLCSMAVIQGRCKAENYRIDQGRATCSVAHGEQVVLQPTSSEFYKEGVVATVAGGDIHRIGNDQGNGSDLTTVHFYLPPIETMRCFEATTGLCQVVRPETLPGPR